MMETLSAVTNYISEFRYEQGVTWGTSYYVPLTIGVVYLVGVYLLRMVMEKRERIPAKTISLIHNFNMYAISIICFAGIAYGVGKTLFVRREKGSYKLLAVPAWPSCEPAHVPMLPCNASLHR
jgi:hypothetical protein